MRGAFSGAFGARMKASAAEWAKKTPNLTSLPEYKDPNKKMTQHKIAQRAVRRKMSGMGGPSPFSQASKPIDLLKSGGMPPTATPLPKNKNNY